MRKTSLSPTQLLSFFREVEKLKTTLRHSWLNDGIRQESVAEHTWMMSLLALVVLPHMEKKLDLQKTLSMIVIHDLAEAVTQDLPVWEGTKNAHEKKMAEKIAVQKLFSHLDETTKAHLVAIWEEYETRASDEAKFVKALDTLDVITQHNIAPLSTWDDNDYFWQLSPLQDGFCNIDPLLIQIKDEIDRWSIAKVKEANQLDKLDQIELEKRKDEL